MTKIVEVEISKLVDKFDIRNTINQDHVEFLAGLIAGGTDLGPIKITKDYIIVDGRHRIEAFKFWETKTIKAIIVENDTPMGILTEALSSNMGGALPPTKADLRRVMTILINKNYSKKRIYEEFKEILPLSLIKTSYQYALLRINNKKVIEVIQLINDSGLTKEKAAGMVGIPVEWVTKKLNTGKNNGEYIQAMKAELNGYFNHFNKKLGKAYSRVLQGYDDALATKNDTQRVIRHLGLLITNQNRMYVNWQRRWNYKK